MVLAIGQGGRVERYVGARFGRARLGVEEGGQPVGGAADVVAAPAIFVYHLVLDRLAIDLDDRFVHARAGVRSVEGHVAGAAHGGVFGEAAAHRGDGGAR